MSLDKTEEYRKRSLIAQGALTNSKRPESFVKGVYPSHVEKAQDCYVWDADGNRYTDYICSLGSTILGHTDGQVIAAIKTQLDNGILFSLSSIQEVDLAEKLKAVFPYMEKMRFLKTGSEGCSAAVKIARAYTNKKLVYTEGYHGWHDLFTEVTPPAVGVVKTNSIFPLKESSYLEQAACVIIEPVVVDISQKRIDYLKELREKCTESGALLVFDETITALRVPKLSIANYSGIKPDISIKGKALANGMPISVVGGEKEIMESDYFVSSTFAGEIPTMAAVNATLNQITGPKHIDEIYDEGAKFVHQFNKLSPDLVRINGYGTRGIFESKDELTLALFFQEAVKAGMLFCNSWFFNYHLKEETYNTIALCRNILMRIKAGNIKLEGDMPIKPYSLNSRRKP